MVMRALELSEKHQFVPVAAFCRCVLGVAPAQLGQSTEGIALIRHGIAGMTHPFPFHFCCLATAQECEGAIGEAIATVEQALQASSQEMANRPEALRLRGELRLKHGQTELAESDFRESIALPRNMSAKAWELRTTMSLSSALASQGHRTEAHSMLADIYNWSTQGFDTADLKEAKALLDELSR
jgi:hypothetical protein